MDLITSFLKLYFPIKEVSHYTPARAGGFGSGVWLRILTISTAQSSLKEIGLSLHFDVMIKDCNRSASTS